MMGGTCSEGQSLLDSPKGVKLQPECVHLAQHMTHKIQGIDLEVLYCFHTTRKLKFGQNNHAVALVHGGVTSDHQTVYVTEREKTKNILRVLQAHFAAERAFEGRILYDIGNDVPVAYHDSLGKPASS